MTITYPAGDQCKEYKGSMKNGKRHGHGVLTFRNGKVHSGMFENGQFTGTINSSDSQRGHEAHRPPAAARPAEHGSDAAWDTVMQLAGLGGGK
jgi:hypothetical protein